MKFARYILLLLMATCWSGIAGASAQKLQKATASQVVLFGPIADSTDASRETALTVTPSELIVCQDSGSCAAKNDSNNCTHAGQGVYSCQLDATDTAADESVCLLNGEPNTLPLMQCYEIESSSFASLRNGTTPLLTAQQAGNSLHTTVATVTDQQELILTAGASNNDAYAVGSQVRITGGTETCDTTVADYVGSTKTVHLDNPACPMTIQVADEIYIFAAPSAPFVNAIKDQTDLFNFTAGNVDANAKAVNDEAISGVGTSGNPFTPFYTDASVAVQSDQDAVRRAIAQNDTTIATLASQVQFTLTAGSADDNAYNGCDITITDQSTATQFAVGDILDYTGSTKTVLLRFDPAVFTMATGDLATISCPGR